MTGLLHYPESTKSIIAFRLLQVDGRFLFGCSNGKFPLKMPSRVWFRISSTSGHVSVSFL